MLEGSHLLVALQQVQLPAQGMVKDGAVAPKEVMEINSMLAMITKDKYLFHPRVLPRLPLLARYHHSHRFKSASPDISILIYVGTICLLPY